LSQAQNIYGCIVISVDDQPTAPTAVGTLTQRHYLSMVATTAILTGVRRIHSDVLPASICSFAGQYGGEHTPRSVMDALSETMAVDHAIDSDVLDSDGLVAVDDASRFLMDKVMTEEYNSFMHSCHSLAALPALRAALDQLRVLTLHSFERLFLGTEETRGSR